MYSSLGFQLNRGIFNSQQHGGSTTSSIHSYKSPTDTISTILAPGYFPNNFDNDIVDIKVGDLIWLIGTDNFVISKITSLTPASIIVSPMTNVFPDGITTSSIDFINGGGFIDFFAVLNLGVNWSGPFASPVGLNPGVQGYVVNNLCTLVFTQLPFTNGVSSSVIMMSPSLPVNFHPTSTKSFGPFLVVSNSTRFSGTMQITSSGIVTISADLTDSGAFTGPGACGFYTIPVTFNLN